MALRGSCHLSTEWSRYMDFPGMNEDDFVCVGKSWWEDGQAIHENSMEWLQPSIFPPSLSAGKINRDRSRNRPYMHADLHPSSQY